MTFYSYFQHSYYLLYGTLLYHFDPCLPCSSPCPTHSRIRVVGVDNLNVTQDVVYVEAGIYHGGELLGDTLVTNEQARSLHPRWNQWLVFDTTVKNLPKAARLCLKVRGRGQD